MTERRRPRHAAMLSRIVVAGASASGMFALAAAMGAAARPDGPTLVPVVVGEAPASPTVPAPVGVPAPSAAPAPVVTAAPPAPATAPEPAHRSAPSHRDSRSTRS